MLAPVTPLPPTTSKRRRLLSCLACRLVDNIAVKDKALIRSVSMGKMLRADLLLHGTDGKYKTCQRVRVDNDIIDGIAGELRLELLRQDATGNLFVAQEDDAITVPDIRIDMFRADT